MKEYTALAALSVFLALFLDRKMKTALLGRMDFAVFLAVILFFKLLVNGFLTGRQVVLYNPRFFLGIRLGSIPAEDFLFGFSMVATSLVLWEYFKKKGL